MIRRHAQIRRADGSHESAFAHPESPEITRRADQSDIRMPKLHQVSRSEPACIEGVARHREMDIRRLIDQHGVHIRQRNRVERRSSDGVKTSTSDTIVAGPASDAAGVDHNFDTIYIWLNPVVNLTFTSSTTIQQTGFNYDMTDPFWGSKLVEKVAENILSALKNPEEAIFKAPEERETK